MARIRSIKPEFFRSLTIAGLSVTARLTFVGLWTHVDDEGREIDDARIIKAAVWPLDDKHTLARVERDLKELERAGRLVRYTVDGQPLLQVVNWTEHQKINRPRGSKWPPPPSSLTEDSRSDHGAITEPAGRPPSARVGSGSGSGSPPAPPDSAAPLPPDHGVEGGSAPPRTATPTPDPSVGDVEQRALLAFAELGRRLPPDVTVTAGPALQEQLRRVVAAGWLAGEIAEHATAHWPSKVAAPERLIVGRLQELAGREAPAVAHERRMAAEAAEDAAKAAERAAVDEQRAVLEERLDALDGEEAAALAREAWEQLPPAVRGPAPDLGRPAVRGMARSLLAERDRLVTAGGGRP